MPEDEDAVHVDYEVRRWLEGLNSDDIIRIEKDVSLYSKLEQSTSAAWLASLRPEDVDRIGAALKFYGRVEGAFWFNRWVMIILVSSFLLAAQFGDAAIKLFGWIRGKG